MVHICSQATLHSFEILAVELGGPLTCEKTEGSTTVLTFGGIELDTSQLASYLS